jgi:hypothetical protein
MYVEAKNRAEELCDGGMEFGLSWGVAIKNIIEEYGGDELELRVYIATETGKNKKRHEQHMKKMEIEKMLASIPKEIKERYKKLWSEILADRDGKLTEQIKAYCLVEGLDPDEFRYFVRAEKLDPEVDNSVYEKMLKRGEIKETMTEFDTIEGQRKLAMIEWFEGVPPIQRTQAMIKRNNEYLAWRKSVKT